MITQTVCDVSCRDETHKIMILFDEDNLDYVPCLQLQNHTADDIASESVIHSMKGSVCKCMEFIVNWRGAARAFLLPQAPAEGEKQRKFQVSYKVET